MASSRLERLRSVLSQQGLDALIVSRPENCAYTSGFTGSAGTLVITADHALLVTDFRYTEQATAQAPDFTVIQRDPQTTTYHAVGRLLLEHDVQRVGLEANFVTIDEYDLFGEYLDDIEVVKVVDLIEDLRMIKDADELALMRQAAVIADEGWMHIVPFIKPGVSEWDLAVELEYKMKKLGAAGSAFEIIIASGERSALPHGVASTRVIRPGDLVTFDYGARYRGYCSDVTRTVVIGEPTPKQREIYQIVLEAQLMGLAACRPYMTGMELDQVCRSYIASKGYGEAFGHSTGHGIGRYVHEGPRVGVRGEHDVLKPAMVVTIEPGIYLPGWGGVRIEDMVEITETGCERLTRTSKELLVL